ncbi:MAG: hypothetical protein M3Y56_04665 [Armatimonadota bacterium]|nr:hypothetical protein [Armatimonadota bacterium]
MPAYPLSLLGLLGAIGSLASPVCAAPIIAVAPGSMAVPAGAALNPPHTEEGDQKDWIVLQQRLVELSGANAGVVLTAYSKFFDRHPNLSAAVGVEVSLAEARFYSDRMGDTRSAIRAYDGALARWGNHPSAILPITEKGRVLGSAGRLREGEQWYAANLPRILKAWPQSEPLEQYTGLLEKDGNLDSMTGVLLRLMAAQPACLDPPPNENWIYSRITDALLRARRQDDALGWAKLRYMTCAYSEASMDRSTTLLAHIWVSGEGPAGELQRFGAAQVDATAPNPLRSIPLPAGAGQIFKDSDNSPQGRDRITAEMVEGKFYNAMMDALALQQQPDTQKPGVREVCRVFKAADLSIQRAEAYKRFVDTGKGPNPVDAFLKEHAPSATGHKE